jgi:hypothetical protein
MRRRDAPHGSTRPRRSGTALFTALVFLLVLTLLGTFGMDQARLQHRMSGNARFQALALANADYVLAAAEADLEAQTADPFHPDRPGDHYYPQDMRDLDPVTPGIQQPADRVWTFGSARVGLPDIDGDGSDSDGDGIADDGTGRYIIQDAGVELILDGHGSRSAAPTAQSGSPRQVFLVTARSRIPGGAQRTIQGVYARSPLALPGAQSARLIAPANGPSATAPEPAYGRRAWIDLHD